MTLYGSRQQYAQITKSPRMKAEKDSFRPKDLDLSTTFPVLLAVPW